MYTVCVRIHSESHVPDGIVDPTLFGSVTHYTHVRSTTRHVCMRSYTPPTHTDTVLTLSLSEHIAPTLYNILYVNVFTLL